MCIRDRCNSVRATKMALKLSDITITEAGFGADLGAEKFFDIKCRMADVKPCLLYTSLSYRQCNDAESR